MSALIDITKETTVREFLDNLGKSLAGKMGMPIEIEMCRWEDDPLDVARFKIVDQGNFVELRMFE
jgi:hypothetical protein